MLSLSGAELLPRLAVPASVEADRRPLHKVGARGKHAQAQQHRIRAGRVRGGIRQAAVDARLCLSAADAHGRKFQEPADNA